MPNCMLRINKTQIHHLHLGFKFYSHKKMLVYSFQKKILSLTSLYYMVHMQSAFNLLRF